jgi:RNA polymerase sigma-70 factor, ECF subfamily
MCDTAPLQPYISGMTTKNLTLAESPPLPAGRLWFAATEADWAALYTEQLPRVYNFFRYRVGNSTEAEDLTATTFEKAWRARHRYRRDLAGFSTWLLTIARNVATDHLRAAHHHQPIEDGLDVSGGQVPEDVISRDSDLRRLLALITLLPDREKELLALKYGANLNNRAIAKLTSLSESNVGTILHRLTESLRTQWTS